MGTKPLFTIGHGSRTSDEFLRLVRKFKIEYLIDVRSQPYSKFNPQFSQNELKWLLEKNGIRYVFMGDSIGGRPKDASCYDADGRVDYEAVKSKSFFLQGIDRLKVAHEKGINVVIMCSEANPCECHRSKLIGRVLDNEKIIVNHIDEKGKIRDQASVINELNKGRSDIDLFGTPINGTSRKSDL